MSGQPNINPMDAAKFRQQYLANLALQANIDDYNLQANKIFKRTGAASQPTDTRTTSEKQADLYRLRIEVRSKLGDIADGANADKIVQQLNTNQLVFLSDQINAIVADLKPKYRTGILAEVFMPYFEKYMDTYQKTKGVNAGLQQDAGERIILNQQLILANMATKTDIQRVDKAINEIGAAGTQLGRSIKANLNELTSMVEYLPEYIQEQQQGNPLTQSSIQETLNNLVKTLPTKNDLENLITKLYNAQASRDTEQMKQLLDYLEEITDLSYDTKSELEVLRQLVAQAKAEAGEQPQELLPAGEDPLELPIPNVLGNDTFYIDPKTIGATPNKGELISYLDTLARNFPPKSTLLLGRTETSVKATKESLKQFLTERDEYIRQKWRAKAASIPTPAMAEAVATPTSSPAPKKTGTGLRRGRVPRPLENQFQHYTVLSPNVDIDMSAGVKAAPRYVPFGRYVIHRGQLDKNIVSIKRPRGGAIAQFGSKRVSMKLGALLRKVIGGSIPSFDEIQSLDEVEKEYLYRLSELSDIMDKVNIPTPNKDQNEKDVNTFEIMRGQILAGNDSEELIQNFKQLIIRLSKKGLIPKRQVNELLFDFTQNGY